MTRMLTAKTGGKTIGIQDALMERDHARQRKVERPEFRCVECGELVRAHKAGGHASAHFEHLARNKACSLSDVHR